MDHIGAVVLRFPLVFDPVVILDANANHDPLPIPSRSQEDMMVAAFC